MAGLLGDVFSFGDTLKRKAKGLLADPVGTLQQFVGNENDRAGQFNQLTADAAQEASQTGKLYGPKSQQLAGLLADGYNPAAMFIGAGAKTWDKSAAEKAKGLLAKGADPKQVWKETGTFKGADGALRQEIDDSVAMARDYQLTPKEALKRAGNDAMINDDNLLRERVASMRTYAGMTKNQLTQEYKSTGQQIIDAATSGNKDEALALMHGRSGLDGMLSEMRNASYGPASAYLKHGDLGKAYPDVYKMHTRIDPDELSGGALGHYFRGGNGQGEQIVVSEKPTWSKSKSTMLHEIQHAIQQREGWAKGGSPENAFIERNLSDLTPLVDPKSIYASGAKTTTQGPIMVVNDEGKWLVTDGNHRYAEALKRGDKTIQTHLDPSFFDGYSGNMDQAVKDAAKENYKRLAGEAEARATQARMNMNAAQRREVYPFDSYDVPVDQLIVRGGLLGQ